MKTFTGKLSHGRVHRWRREDAGHTAISLCGIVSPREFVSNKGFQWPECRRCAKLLLAK